MKGWQIALVAVVLLITIGMIVFAFRTAYYAFIKKKDERLQWIVTKSLAQAFVVAVIYQGLVCFAKWFFYDFYTTVWENFKEGIYMEPVFVSLLLLGGILLINKKKFGD